MEISKCKKYKILSIIILIFLGIFILFTITEKSRAEKALEKIYTNVMEKSLIYQLYTKERAIVEQDIKLNIFIQSLMMEL